MKNSIKTLLFLTCILGSNLFVVAQDRTNELDKFKEAQSYPTFEECRNCLNQVGEAQDKCFIMLCKKLNPKQNDCGSVGYRYLKIGCSIAGNVTSSEKPQDF